MVESPNRSPEVIWLEKAGLASLLFYAFKGVFSGIFVKFDLAQTSPLALKFAEAFNGVMGREIISPAALSLNQKDENGYALEYYRGGAISQAMDSFCRKYIPDETKDFKHLVRCYLSLPLDASAAFIVMAKKQASGMKGCRHRIRINGNFGSSLLAAQCSSEDTLVESDLPLASYINLTGAVMFHTLKMLIGWIISDREPHAPSDGISLWIESPPAHGVWKIFRDYLSRVVREKEYAVCYYFDRADTPCDHRVISGLRREGFGSIDLNGFELSVSPGDVAEAVTRSLAAMRVKTPVWLFLFRYRHFLLSVAYSRLFARYNVKALIQHQETNWIQEAQAQAIKSVGGAMFGLHWSNYPSCNWPSYLTPQHVFFVWGRLHAHLLRRKGNTCEHILPAGIWVGEESNTTELRRRFAAEVKFLVAAFDNNAVYNLYQSPETLSRFYLGIIGLLEENSGWGVIIKSKSYSLEDLSLFPEGGIIKRKLGDFIRAKRAVMLDFTEYTPVIAAKNADLSICYGINSGGIIAGLYGCKAIHWDCVGWLKYPLYRHEYQRVIFQSWADIRTAAKKCADGDGTIGDLSPFQKDFNYFRDSSGLNRILQFVDMFMGEIAISGRNEAMAKAVAAYVEKNKVTDDFNEYRE